jgi:hypothetical protein
VPVMSAAFIYATVFSHRAILLARHQPACGLACGLVKRTAGERGPVWAVGNQTRRVGRGLRQLLRRATGHHAFFTNPTSATSRDTIDLKRCCGRPRRA